MTSMFSSILGEKRFRPDSPPRSADGLAQALGDEGLATLTSELKMFLRAELSGQLKSAVVEAITTLKTEIQIHIAAVMETFDAKIPAIVETAQAKVEANLDAKLQTTQETVRAGYEVLENHISTCASSLDALERKIRSPNTILFGVEESVGEIHLNKVKSLLSECKIKEAVRLGKYIATSKRPRPVLIRFDTIADKHSAYKKAKDLRRQFKVSMDDDITPQQRAARGAQLPQVLALRSEGWTTFWRGDNLFKVKGQGPPIKVLPGNPAAPSPPAAGPSSPPVGGPSSSRA